MWVEGSDVGAQTNGKEKVRERVRGAFRLSTYMSILAARVGGIGVQVGDSTREITAVVLLAGLLLVLAPLALHHDGEPDDVITRLDRRHVPGEKLVGAGKGPVGQVGEVVTRRGALGGEGGVEVCEAWEVGLRGGRGVISMQGFWCVR